MAKFFISAPAIFPSSIVEEGKKINYGVSYPHNKKKEGHKVEVDVYNLLLLLEADEVFMPPSEVRGNQEYLSFLDTCLKVDILVKVGETYFTWQVKSNVPKAKEYLNKYKKVSFNKKAYPAPGVIMLDSYSEGKVGWKYLCLREISRTSGIPIQPAVLQAVEKWRKLAKAKIKEIPIKVFSVQECTFLTVLGLITFLNSRVIKLNI